MNAGLEDVVAAKMVLSDVDSNNVRLIVRGASLGDLVATSTYEDVLGLLFDGFFPLSGAMPGTLGTARADTLRMLTGAMPPGNRRRRSIAIW